MVNALVKAAHIIREKETYGLQPGFATLNIM